MKKVISVLLAMLMLLGTVTVAFAADGARALLHVAISDKSGKLALPNKLVLVEDIDKDGALTVNDALYCAHEQYFEGGAAKGYGTYESQYGLSLGKLWGEENKSSFGYYVNDNMAWNLTDTVKEGDFIYAWSYRDAEGYSDSYSFFNDKNVKAKSHETIEVTYNVCSYDENWNPVSAPCEGAEITVDGLPTGILTGKDGKAKVVIPVSGEHVISAKAPKPAEGESEALLVPPVCRVTVDFDIWGLINYIIDSIVSFVKGLFTR